MDSSITTSLMRSLKFLVLMTSAATIAAAQQPGPRRCRDCAEAKASQEARAVILQDSVRAQGRNFEGDIERVAAQLLVASQLQTQAQQALSALLSGRVAEANRVQAQQAVQRFRQQLDQATRESQGLRAQLASLCDRNAKPQGYMGITFSATMRADAAASGTEIFRFAENPTVETVEPGSPAERAGVQKGDEIIEIDRQAVVGRDIVFSRLLRPGNRLPLRVQRDGDARNVVLLITQRPPSLDNGCPFLDARIMAAFGDPIMVGRLPMSGAIVRAVPYPPNAATPGPGQRVRILQPGEAPVAIATSPNGTVTIATPAPMVPSATLPAPAVAETPAPRNVFVFSGASTPSVIAGATIVRTNADLRETFGVKSGVLVLDVARGSVAYNSGLKGGDIIVAAGRTTVTSPLSIQRAIETADGELRLRIIRKKKEQSLTLRW